MAGPWEQYQAQAEAKPWEQYQPQATEAPKEGGGVMQALGNTAAGMLRGAGSIGATLLAPYDVASDALAGRGLSLQSNRERRAAMDAGLQTMGAQPDSLLYKGGKLAGEIAGTAGAGGAVANVAGRVPLIARTAAPLLSAIKTGGMAANGLTGPTGLAVRSAGGAINGLAQVGLASPDDALMGAAMGGALPSVLGVGGKVIGATGKALGSLTAPLSEKGQRKIIGNVLREAAGGKADDVAQALASYRPSIHGVKPTVAEIANSPGLASLQRSATAVDPAVAQTLADRAMSNSDARMAALDAIIPDKTAAMAARTQAAESLYQAASSKPLQITPKLESIFSRPSAKKALDRAQQLAAESGRQIDPASMTGADAHYIKMALDDIANSGPASGMGGNEVRAVKNTLTEFLGEVEKQIPEYGKARDIYAKLSKPINQADLLTTIKGRSTRALDDALLPGKFASNLNDKVAQSVTGYKGSKLADVLTPAQLKTLEAVRGDLAGVVAAQNVGRGVGSDTVQKLAYANMINNMPLPASMRSSTVGGLLGGLAQKGGNLVYGNANRQMQGLLAESMLDPQLAAALMAPQKAGLSLGGLSPAARFAPGLLAFPMAEAGQ